MKEFNIELVEVNIGPSKIWNQTKFDSNITKIGMVEPYIYIYIYVMSIQGHSGGAKLDPKLQSRVNIPYVII